MDFKFVLMISGCFILGQAQFSINGTKCPEYMYSMPCLTPNISISNDKLVGTWFVHHSIPHFFENEMKCSFLNVSEVGENHLQFTKTEFYNDNEDIREIFGTIEYFNESTTCFYYTDLYFPFYYHTVLLTEDVWVVVSCNECGFYEHQGAGIYAYVFTRLQHPLCESQEEALTALAKCNIPKKALTLHEQSNCPFC